MKKVRKPYYDPWIAAHGGIQPPVPPPQFPPGTTVCDICKCADPKARRVIIPVMLQDGGGINYVKHNWCRECQKKVVTNEANPRK